MAQEPATSRGPSGMLPREPLLATKLYIPPVRPSLVSRPRLLAQLERGLRSRLILVSAPAGFGKTTLISEWIHSQPSEERPKDYCPPLTHNSQPTTFPPSTCFAWVSLDVDDNDPVRFMRYLIAALQTIAPGVGEAALALLHSPQLPPLTSVLTALVSEWCPVTSSEPGAPLIGERSALPSHAVLVLDDYHLIDMADIHQAVTFLIEHLAPQMHLAILTRADPPLPLARLRAGDQLTEIRAAHLRFTLEETAAFLRRVLSVELSLPEVAALGARAEGWIAGLQLATLSMQGRDADQLADFIVSFTGSHHYIVDYLAEQVLDRQPEAVRSFLLQTSILDRMSAELCEVMTGSLSATGQAMLERLEHANVFVVPLDDERHWYRYHTLFADVLRSRLRQMHPDRLPELHRRAAQWYEEQGLVSEAIGHALAAEDRDRAIRLVERYIRPIFMRGELVTLASWLRALGPAVHERPWLGIHQAWTVILTGQREGIEPLLQEVERSISGGSPPGPAERQEMLGEIAAMRGLAAYNQGDVQRAMQLCQQALAGLRADNDVVRGIAAHVLAVASKHSGDVAAAVQAHVEAVHIGKASGSILLAVSALSSLGDIRIEQGRLHQAAETYRQALQLTALPNGTPLLADGRAYVCLGKVFYEWNDLEAVTRYVRQGLELCQRGGIVEYQATGYVILARTRQAQGDLDGAQEALHHTERLMLEHSLSADTTSSVQAGRVRLWLAQGNLEIAARWAQHAELEIDRFSYIRVAEYLVLVRVLLAQGEHVAALALLERLLRTAEATGRMGRAILLLVFQALALQASANIPRALAALERALTLAQPEGYVRTFLDEGVPMARLLRHAGSRGIAPSYVSRLLSEFDRIPGATPARQPLIEPLSERELQVLRLLAAGQSTEGIAAELVLATGTVKRHLNNIFGKLSVQSRVQCVARARELHLI